MNNIDEPLFEDDLRQQEPGALHNADLADQIRKLVANEMYCILGTQGDNQPYGSLIAYAHTGDLKHFFFKTQMTTRKYKLLIDCPQVALVIDSRCRHQEDMTKVEAVTITGKATQLKAGPDHQLGIKLLRNRHAYLANFLDSESTALFRIDVLRYFHVIRFQEVSQWIP